MEIVTPEELKRLPLFEHLPYKFLAWNANAVVRRDLGRGQQLFREGEYGTTAFVLLDGYLRLEIRAAMWHAGAASPSSWLKRARGQRELSRLSRVEAMNRQRGGQAATIRTDAGGPLSSASPFRFLPPDPRRIIGEGACLNNYPRAQTATASANAVVLEFRRNVLLAMLRNPLTRRQVNECYRLDALAPYLMGTPLFAPLDGAQRSRAGTFLSSRVDLVDFVRVHPKQVIFREGELADHLYLVRVGFVKVSRSAGAGEEVLDYIGPGGSFGELGLVADAAPGQVKATALGSHTLGRRLTTCTALDTVELVRIRGDVFRELIAWEPALLPPLVEACSRLIEKYWGDQGPGRSTLDSYLDEGLQAARQLLVIDLERCTRCDECSKACADSHDGVTRLIREGVRHGKYLVATSCRSCVNPYCMAGCPVDAIHRGKGREIVIEDWCIGCGSCERNCPYENIRMVAGRVELVDPDDPARAVVVEERKATTCDLCQGFLDPGEKPSCVFACPHDAAFRVNGAKFLDMLDAAAQDGTPAPAGNNDPSRSNGSPLT